MKIIRKDNTTEEEVFWLNFIMSIILPFMFWVAPATTQYTNYKKNSLKWKGALWGLIPGVFIYVTIATFLKFKNSTFIIVSIISLFAFITSLFLIIKNRNRIMDNTLVYSEQEIANVTKTIEANASRIYLERNTLKDLVLKNNEQLFKAIENRENGKEWLLNLYSAVVQDVKVDDFEIHIYDDIEDKKIIIIELPKSDSDILFKMVGIIKTNKGNRCFCFDDHVIEYLKNGMRVSYLFNQPDVCDFYQFLKEEAKVNINLD